MSTKQTVPVSVVHDEECETDEDEEMPYDTIIRAKWLWDGCTSLDQVIIRQYEMIEDLKRMKEEGYELQGPIQNDCGYLKRRVSESSQAQSQQVSPGKNAGPVPVDTPGKGGDVKMFRS